MLRTHRGAAGEDESCDGSSRGSQTGPVIEARGVHVAHGRLPVVFDVDLAVDRGSVLGLLGANGAGKTTLLAALAGLLPVERGTVHLLGADVTAEPAERRIRRGMALVQGGAAIFPTLSVLENLRAGCFPIAGGEAAAAERRDAALEMFPVLRQRLAQRAGTLSGGERQMLALSKGLMLGGELLCIDELSLGLAPVLLEQLVEVVERLREQGRTMIIVDQSVSLILRLADQVMVLERGRVVLRGDTEALADDLAGIEAALLGGAA